MILLYHKVAPVASTIWWVSADTFDRQMAALAAYDVVPLSDYDPANPRHVVITFDGVYENVYQFAFPILRKWGYPFELFVTGDYIGRDNAFDAPEPLARFCTIEQLEAMAGHGGRIQWHTASHQRLDRLSESDLLREVEVPPGLRSRFSSPHLDWFAYPHGDHSEAAVAAVKARFKGALSCVAGNDEDRYQLNRVTVDEGTKLDKSRVTVIVANYNYGAFLPEAMESVLKQTVSPDEIILIDDCSTDGSQDIARRYEGVARVILNERNLGIVDNFNKAVSFATGDYIAFLGADNRMRSDYVERCKTALDRQPEAAIAYTDMMIFGARAPQLAESVGATLIGESVAERWPVYLWQFPEPTPETLANLDTKNFIHGSSMYRRSAFDQIGGYRKSDGPEDHNLFKRMLQVGWQPFHVREALIEYRQHSANQANTVLSLQMELAATRRLVGEMRKIAEEREAAIAARNAAISECAVAVSERDAAIAERHAAVAERDAAVYAVSAIRSSSSWRVTAPLRFLGHLRKGNYDIAVNVAREAVRRLLRRVPSGPQRALRRATAQLLSTLGAAANSRANAAAIATIVEHRCSFTRDHITVDPLCALAPQVLPAIDISVVTYNSARWIAGFVDSLIDLDYPKDALTVHFVDNSSTDSTLTELDTAAEKLRAAGFSVNIMRRPNRGFGAGHNAAIAAGSAPFCLVTNVDLTFEPDTLRKLVSVAVADAENAAAWEVRQKPYEHPKFYDPVTGVTNWNSHACVLLRRTALDRVGRYDDTIFMYGEDVELSYRLRRAGFLLRYCPNAVVWHYSYDTADQIKPIQYIGSTFANLYIRLKYGDLTDMLAVPVLGVRLLAAPEAFPGSRKAVMRSLLRIVRVAPKALLSRRRSTAAFPFRTWDYEATRDGAFVEQHVLPTNAPLVSVITRTYRGRELYLRQALLSVAHQTYPHIEHIVVEDGGTTMRAEVDRISNATGRSIQFIGLEKLGRSAAGNAGLAAAKGRWCVFLDDDDLLFADHVETLVDALLRNKDAVAAYSPAWEVNTDGSEIASGKYVESSHSVPAPLRQDFDYLVLKHHNFMAIQSVLFERRLYEAYGGFETDMDALEDWVLWLRYAHGHQDGFVYVPRVTSLFRTPVSPATIASRQKAFDVAYPLALAKLAAHIDTVSRSPSGRQDAAAKNVYQGT